MITRRSLLFAAPATALLLSENLESATTVPKPYGVLPSANQLAWHELETYSFIHFTVNTFSGREWGEGDEDVNLFAPTDYNPEQMVNALKSAGMKAVILTCKHHDGFCLWPTKTTEHSIAHCSWRGGKGDVVRDISNAARKHGLKFGVYLSPWDRNNAAYGKPEYIEIYRRQLTELLTGYGPVCEVWHDGANGGTGYYGGAKEKRTIDKTTYYDWPNTWALTRKLQPHAVIFSDAGPDVRWVGNEKGFAGESCWATFTPTGEKGGPAFPGDVDSKQSVQGTRDGKYWMPAECDVSIRPGWFWHAAENSKVRTRENLMDLYYKSTGRGASMLLNVPPDTRGQFAEEDVKSLREFGEFMKATFGKNLAVGAKLTASNTRGNSKQFRPENLLDGGSATYWSTDDSVTTPDLTLDFSAPVTFNVITLRENLRLGQRIAAFRVEQDVNGSWQKIAEATSVGNCRHIRLEKPATAGKLRLRITDCPVPPALSLFGLYAEPS